MIKKFSIKIVSIFLHLMHAGILKDNYIRQQLCFAGNMKQSLSELEKYYPTSASVFRVLEGSISIYILS